MKLLNQSKILNFSQHILIFLLVPLAFTIIPPGCNKSKNKKFNSKEWKANEKSRFAMLDDIVNNKLFIGKSKQELLDSLGKPFIKEDSFYNRTCMIFRTPEKSGEYLHWHLFVELKSDTVTYTQKSLD
jgi:hypothetical protein